MGIIQVNKLAIKRRERRWKKEMAAFAELETHEELVRAIADWKGVTSDLIKLSNIACRKAPADLGCVFVSSFNPMRNPCLFCRGMEEDV